MKRRRASGPQSLLILHLDAKRLRDDGLHLGEIAQHSATLSTVTLGSRTVVRDVASHGCFLDLLGELRDQKATFDVVVVIGHSNSAGIRIASDHFATWAEFATNIKLLQPRRLLLAACRAGRWNAGEALFRANRHLRRIFACPVNASRDFAAMMLFAVPYVVARRAPRDKHVLWSQVGAIVTTGRQLREWRRTTDKGNPDSSVFDLIADVADPLARQVPGTLRSLLKSVLRG